MSAYQRWLEADLLDKDLKEELLSINGQEDQINDRFYRDLEFGTAGLRGVIGAGTNRMNVHTVAKATQGLANYLNKNKVDGKVPSVAIAYDSRNKGLLFTQISASVLAANGVKAYVYDELMPTPALSFAVRYLKCDAGICVTASHNPAKYNGYKAYGNDGCQISSDVADGIIAEIEKLDIFEDIKLVDFDKAVSENCVEYIANDCYEAFISAVLNERILDNKADNLKVVYTPLNGSGKKCVLRILDEISVKDITVVPEQSEPDGNFPTCSYPNPEVKDALQKGLDLSQEIGADLLIATDPDCDRVGIAVKHGSEYKLMSGNEVGALLLDFMARFKLEKKTMPAKPYAVTTIVSTDIVTQIAKKYNIELFRVLTGFKFICGVVADMEEQNNMDGFLFGFEESYGYVKGSYVRDKDAVNASMLIAEMASYYKALGKDLVEIMDELYNEFGYYINDGASFTFEGEDGMNAMNTLMCELRTNPPTELAGMKVVGNSDYNTSVSVDNGIESTINLPKSNVLEYRLENDNKLIVRPSGTEPKIKIYISAVAETKAKAVQISQELKIAGTKLLGQ